MSTLSDLRHFIARHDLIPAGAGVVVGVSGGPDSLALLHALAQLAPEFDWRLQAAYLHHGLRGEAGAEARFVAEVAGAWGLGCTVERTDVRALAAQPGLSLEEAARQARYAFLGRTALRLGAAIVAVGHHAADQAETVLMHLLRGSGLAGLRGMLPATPLAGLRLPALPQEQRPDFGDIRLVRPWLRTPRADILAYCRAHDLEPRYDASNADTTLFRNRLRHEIIPALQAINPRLSATLGRTAAVLAGDHESLRARRRLLWADLARIEDSSVCFELAHFRALPRGDQRALLRRAIACLRPDLRDIHWAHTETLLDLLASEPDRASGGPYSLVAGLEARLDYGELHIGAGSPSPSGHPQVYSPGPLSLPGDVSLADGWRLSARARHWSGHPPWQGEHDDAVIWLPLDVPAPVTVRGRRPGERMYPFGLGGSKAIAGLMTEHKLPRQARAAWPLLVDARGEILWLVGRRPAEACRLPPYATAAWEVRLVQREDVMREDVMREDVMREDVKRDG